MSDYIFTIGDKAKILSGRYKGENAVIVARHSESEDRAYIVRIKNRLTMPVIFEINLKGCKNKVLHTR